MGDQITSQKSQLYNRAVKFIQVNNFSKDVQKIPYKHHVKGVRVVQYIR